MIGIWNIAAPLLVPTPYLEMLRVHVWPGRWDLPSIDAQCLVVILFLQLTHPGRYVLVECSTPDLSPSGMDAQPTDFGLLTLRRSTTIPDRWNHHNFDCGIYYRIRGPFTWGIKPQTRLAPYGLHRRESIRRTEIQIRRLESVL